MEKRSSSVSFIGEEIRSARKEQGLTQEELAKISGTGTRFISDLENGKESINLGKLLLVAAALGLGLYLLNKWGKK